MPNLSLKEKEDENWWKYYKLPKRCTKRCLWCYSWVFRLVFEYNLCLVGLFELLHLGQVFQINTLLKIDGIGVELPEHKLLLIKPTFASGNWEYEFQRHPLRRYTFQPMRMSISFSFYRYIYSIYSRKGA